VNASWRKLPATERGYLYTLITSSSPLNCSMSPVRNPSGRVDGGGSRAVKLAKNRPKLPLFSGRGAGYSSRNNAQCASDRSTTIGPSRDCLAAVAFAVTITPLVSQASVTLPVRSTVLHSGQGLVMAERRGVAIALWRRKPNRGLFEIQKKCLDDVVAKNVGKAAFLCVVEPTSEPPDDDIRRAAALMVSSHEKDLKCVALVIEGTGFRSAITRTVLSGIVMLIRTPAPIKFFDTPKSACMWIGSQLPTARDGLLEEVEALRGHLDSH
jgi:hypothetical protein